MPDRCVARSSAYIEDPLADFVLRSELEAGATVLVEHDPHAGPGDDAEAEVKLSIIKPERKPVGVGAEGEPSDEGAEPAGDEPAAQE